MVISMGAGVESGSALVPELVCAVMACRKFCGCMLIEPAPATWPDDGMDMPGIDGGACWPTA